MKTILPLAARILTGGLFLSSGFIKLTSPRENFLALIERFDIVYGNAAVIVSYVLPWIEFLGGVFLLVGLWTGWALRLLWALNTVFIGVLGSAVLRRLSIEDCGCFGEKFSFPVKTMLFFDLGMWLVFAVMHRFRQRLKFGSLDGRFP